MFYLILTYLLLQLLQNRSTDSIFIYLGQGWIKQNETTLGWFFTSKTIQNWHFENYLAWSFVWNNVFGSLWTKTYNKAREIKLTFKDFLSKYKQIRNYLSCGFSDIRQKLQIWPMELCLSNHSQFLWVFQKKRLNPLSAEAVVWRCSIKKVFLKILQNSQENTCARVSFLTKLQASCLQLYQKRDSGTGVLLWILWNF